MYSLFSSEPSIAGYRLEYMEILNWGTFDRDVFRISPAGNNSLLTGANGSGKTTYIDALLTLLVPIKKYRFYNRSSGTDKKNERTEGSYVLGAYGETQQEDSTDSKTVYIRPDRKKVYSILLASFSNAEQTPITLFQARWFYSGELKKTFGICRGTMTIEKDFMPFDARGEWKKALKHRYPRQGVKDTLEFLDTAGKYADRLVKHFGMRSDKALSLFNQTVGIKVLGNLDQFIRLNMLEPQEVEEEFQKLKENYETLLDAHRQIEKATEQAKLLTPIRDLAQRVKELEQQLVQLKGHMETLHVYVNHRLQGFLADEIQKQTRNLESLEHNLQETGRRLETYEDRQADLRADIEKDETGRRLKDIEKELKQKEREKSDRQARQEKYNRLASALQLPETPDEHHFNESREQALLLEKKINRDLDTGREHHIQVRIKNEDLNREFKKIKSEVLELKRQKNKITGRVSEIRNEILGHVKAAPDEIPFIGELIKVKDTEKDWESALERLLHNFALRLLVPDKYYDKVNRYVNDNNLKGRLVYHRVKEETFLTGMSSRPAGTVLEKLDLQKKSVYHNWLENRLLKEYDYICTTDLSQFHRHRRAITMQGLIKNKDRHQKDDRPESINRERYVLGWDNKEKIMVLARKAKEIDTDIKENEKQLKKLEIQLKKLGGKLSDLKTFKSYDRFSEIDWHSTALEIEALNKEKKRLEQTSDKIKQLQTELETVKATIRELRKEHERLVEQKVLAKHDIESYEKKKNECLEELDHSPFPREDFNERFRDFENTYPRTSEMTFQNAEKLHKTLEKELKDSSDKTFGRQQKLTQRLSSKMNHFKNPGPEITEKFHDWQAETHKLSEDTQFVDEYITLLERIEHEDLPSYRKKFEDYLSSTMINKIAGFKEFLDEGLESIIENITTLNQSLQKISFKSAPSTYIQLKFPDKGDTDLKDFKRMLRNAIPDAARLHSEDNGHYKKEVFKHIQKLIDKLDKDETWRREVTDVRNWKSYYAEEYYSEDDKPMKIYKDMGKLSGGEKAQLTYTILGSAIAYQFGIKHKGLDADSFRFIAVDETFSNQDDERAKYLMDLCGQLHLQLLVVTPSDKIHIVEPYISYVHYVQRRHNKESLLFDMPIKTFQEKKEEVLAPSQEKVKN